MISRRLLSLMVIAGLVAGCSTLDSLNPFSSSAPKMAALQPFKASTEVRVLWSAKAGKAADYIFTPAVVGNVVYVAGAEGALSRIEDGRVVWKVKAAPGLSAGVAADAQRVIVATPKGEVLAFAADDGKPLWSARVSSEVLAAPVIGDDGVAVKSGDNSAFISETKNGSRKSVYQRATP